MKPLSDGNVFSRYYWEKNNTKNYNNQINQNSSHCATEPTSFRKVQRVTTSKSHKTKKAKPRESCHRKLKRSHKKISSAIEVPKEKNENTNNDVMINFFNTSFSSVEKVSDFCSLFKFYPSLVPCDNYREMNQIVCKTFSNCLEETLAKILSYTKNQEIFKSREFLRFTNELEDKINNIYDNLVEFFQNAPFGCQNGIRFRSIKDLFDHKSCSNCKEQEKPQHICQCTQVFNDHEDWINHTFSRKGASCPVVLFTLFLMHDRYVTPNSSDSVRTFFCYGCLRKTTNFFDLYFHITYCPEFELKTTKNCSFCNKKSRQIYENSNCHRLRSSKSTFSMPNQPSPVNYVKLLARYFKITQPNMLSKKRN